MMTTRKLGVLLVAALVFYLVPNEQLAIPLVQLLGSAFLVDVTPAVELLIRLAAKNMTS